MNGRPLIDRDTAFEHVMHNRTQCAPRIGALPHGVFRVEFLDRAVGQIERFGAVIFDHENRERVNVVGGDVRHSGLRGCLTTNSVASHSESGTNPGDFFARAAGFAGSEALEGEEFHIDLLPAIERVIGERLAQDRREFEAVARQPGEETDPAHRGMPVENEVFVRRQHVHAGFGANARPKRGDVAAHQLADMDEFPIVYLAADM